MTSEYEIIETLVAMAYCGINKGIYTDEMVNRYYSIMDDYDVFHSERVAEDLSEKDRTEILDNIYKLMNEKNN